MFEKLSSYKLFYEANADYLKELGEWAQPGVVWLWKDILKSSISLSSLSLSLILSLSLSHSLSLSFSLSLSLSAGLDHNFCLTKIRQLTLTSLAVEAESGEVTFSALLSELDIPREDLELFLIDGMHVQWSLLQ